MARKVSHLHKPEQLELLPEATQGLKKLNAAGFITVLITNQRIIARGMCTVNELKIKWRRCSEE